MLIIFYCIVNIFQNLIIVSFVMKYVRRLWKKFYGLEQSRNILCWMWINIYQDGLRMVFQDFKVYCQKLNRLFRKKVNVKGYVLFVKKK